MVSIIVGTVVLTLDLWTKWLVTSRMAELQEIKVIDGLFSLQLVHNSGAAFGMLANQQWLFITVSVGVVIGIVYFSRQPEARVGAIPWAMGLLLGGAVGNLLDRIRFGKVVDFLLFYREPYYFPNFNVADIGITVGVGLLILFMAINGASVERESA